LLNGFKGKTFVSKYRGNSLFEKKSFSRTSECTLEIPPPVEEELY
jgi:hypothetical protein